MNALCADPNNTVFVVSGDSQENVEKVIGHIPGLGLAASNGACFAPPLKLGEASRRWKFFDLGVDWEAVKSVRDILLFNQRIPLHLHSHIIVMSSIDCYANIS